MHAQYELMKKQEDFLGREWFTCLLGILRRSGEMQFIFMKVFAYKLMFI